MEYTVNSFLRWTRVQCTFCASPVLSQTYISDPKPVKNEADDGEEIGERGQAVKSPEALI